MGVAPADGGDVAEGKVALALGGSHAVVRPGDAGQQPSLGGHATAGSQRREAIRHVLGLGHQ